MSAVKQESRPQLPERFWELTERIETAWSFMEKLIETEWRTLMSDQVEQLPVLSAKKDALMRFIQKNEKALVMLMAEIAGETPARFPATQKNQQDTTLTDQLLASLHYQDAMRLQAWQARLKSLRRAVSHRNGDLSSWLTDRMQFIQAVQEAMHPKSQNSNGVYKKTAAMSGKFHASPQGQFFQTAPHLTERRLPLAGMEQMIQEGIRRYDALQGTGRSKRHTG